MQTFFIQVWERMTFTRFVPILMKICIITSESAQELWKFDLQVLWHNVSIHDQLCLFNNDMADSPSYKISQGGWTWRKSTPWLLCNTVGASGAFGTMQSLAINLLQLRLFLLSSTMHSSTIKFWWYSSAQSDKYSRLNLPLMISGSQHRKTNAWGTLKLHF